MQTCKFGFIKSLQTTHASRFLIIEALRETFVYDRYDLLS